MKSISASFLVLSLLIISVFFANQASAQITIPDNSGNRDLHATDDDIYTVVEVQPAFSGGDEARILYLQNNIHYPLEARKAGIQGTVYVTFVVEKDGTITDIKILRGIGGGCDEEVVRLISHMPKWSPGMQKGKPVRVQFNMPIRFTLAG
jgi:periplasmic protein TonB